MQIKYRIGVLAGLVLLLTGPGGLARPAPADAVTCGAAWSVVPSPNAGSVDDELRGVSAASATDAWAVGSSVDATTWTVVPSPSPSPDNNRLRAVSAVAANDVWAVGVTGLGTLVEHWDGKQWAIVTSPHVPPGDNRLNAVAALAAGQWAVGYGYVPEFSRSKILIEQRCT